MAPNVISNGTITLTEDHSPPAEKKKEYRPVIVWRNVILFAYLHLAALYGLYLMFTSAKALTNLWVILLYIMSGLGITAGAHRLWSHRSYKANLPLRIILAVFNTLAFQNHIYEWARDHRAHHKYSETDADPHNSRRGFFFSHVGWLLMKKHPLVLEKGKGLDLSDLENDPVVYYQRKYYLIFMPVMCFLLPTIVPIYYWDESLSNAWFVATLFRYTFTLNMTWLVNSAAHLWGNKPYDKSIMPSENVGVALGALGEGWHNYHHVFPWDYKTAELAYNVNFTTAFIDFFAWLGWAWDRKTVPKDVIMKRVARTGDGSHEGGTHGEGSHEGGTHGDGTFWGWGDRDMTDLDRGLALTLNKETKPH